MENNWHNLSFEEVVKKLDTNIDVGLTKKETKKRFEKYGKNILSKSGLPSKFKIFLEQFKSPLIFILVIAGIITLFMAEYTDATVIWAAVILNTFVGYFQENKADEALGELRKILKVNAKVIRDNNQKEIFQEELIPGDIIILNSGDKVPADARIIKSWDLKIDEAILTGEWISSRKNNKTLDKETNLADRGNMVYMGSIVTNGGGKAVVVCTSNNTEIGKVSSMVQGIKERRTPYQQKIKKFLWLLLGIISVITIFIFINGILTGSHFLEIFTLAVAVTVAAIPEGLPVAITAILAVGMQQILKKKGLVRRLISAETLGSSSIIATDKTLTLTQGKMRVQELYTIDSSDKKFGYKIASLANNAFIENPDVDVDHWVVKGSPTDRALLKSGIEYGISFQKIKENELLIYKIPFDSIKKYSAVFYKTKDKVVSYISGAPEVLINLSSNLSKTDKDKIFQKLENFTEKGSRVVAVGYKDFSKNIKINNSNLGKNIQDISFVGLLAMDDPIRDGVGEAIKFARQAGIKVIMVTGDHVRTAQTVASKLNIKNKSGEIIEGSELEKMSDKELEKKLDDIEVYARVEPKHKMRIIKAWQSRGEVIAMTGDGVNDAPALRMADIGIALSSGTDVAKEVSDLILLGDNFSIIPEAIKQGRILVDNIRKVVTYLVSSSFSELILIGTSIIMGWPIPVTAIQILWVNLVEDSLPGISFMFERKEKGVMERKPEPKNSPLLNKEMKTIIFIISLVSNVILIGLFLYLLNYTDYSIEHIRTFIFVALAIDSLFFIFSCKNLKKSIWQYNSFSNKFLNVTVLISLFMMVVVVYIPFFQNFIKTIPLNFLDWIILIIFGFLNLVIVETIKWIFISRK